MCTFAAQNVVKHNILYYLFKYEKAVFMHGCMLYADVASRYLQLSGLHQYRRHRYRAAGGRTSNDRQRRFLRLPEQLQLQRMVIMI